MGAALCPALCLLAAPRVSFASPQPSPSTSPAAETAARPPLILGVAVDEAGIGEGDLERARELVLSLLDVLPPGSQMMLASFSGDRRIVLPPTADRAALASSFAEEFRERAEQKQKDLEARKKAVTSD